MNKSVIFLFTQWNIIYYHMEITISLRDKANGRKKTGRMHFLIRLLYPNEMLKMKNFLAQQKGDLWWIMDGDTGMAASRGQQRAFWVRRYLLP